MDPILIPDRNLAQDNSHEDMLVQAWRAEQLLRLGVPRVLAETYAALVDWHEIAALVARGCSPELALRIVR